MFTHKTWSKHTWLLLAQQMDASGLRSEAVLIRKRSGTMSSRWRCGCGMLLKSWLQFKTTIANKLAGLEAILDWKLLTLIISTCYSRLGFSFWLHYELSWLSDERHLSSFQCIITIGLLVKWTDCTGLAVRTACENWTHIYCVYLTTICHCPGIAVCISV